MLVESVVFGTGLALGLFPTFLVINSLKRAGLYTPEPIPKDFRQEVVKLLIAERPKALPPPGNPPTGGSGVIKAQTSPEVARLLKAAIEDAEYFPFNWEVTGVGDTFSINGARYTGAKSRNKGITILKNAFSGNCSINSLTISREDYDKTIAGILEAKLS